MQKTFRFACRGCAIRNRKYLWEGFVSSMADPWNRAHDNSYMELVEEPNNSYDPNAIKVVCRGEFFGTMGYVGKEFTSEVKKILDKCQSYRVDMLNEEEAGQREVFLVLTWGDKIVLTEEEKELRKKLGLPVTKELRYMQHTKSGAYEEYPVTAFRIVDQYFPSETYSLMIALEDGQEIRILAPYFAQMQKPSFVDDMEKIAE